MPVPPATDAVWTRLANGALSDVKTDHLGTQLLTTRIQRSKDPSPAKAAEIHAFFTKWEKLLANEITQLARL